MSAGLDTSLSIPVFFVLILPVRFKLHNTTQSDQVPHHERAIHDHSGPL